MVNKPRRAPRGGRVSEERCLMPRTSKEQRGMAKPSGSQPPNQSDASNREVAACQPTYRCRLV